MNFAKFSGIPPSDCSGEVSHYVFLSLGLFNKTLLMKIFEDIFAMAAAKEQE